MATKIAETEMTSDLTRHTARAADDGGWTVSWPPGLSASGEPVAATSGGAGQELPVEARLEALDGSERKLLLDQLARAYPDVVEAGFALLAGWRAGCAEHRRKQDRRREHARRRRREEDLGRD